MLSEKTMIWIIVGLSVVVFGWFIYYGTQANNWLPAIVGCPIIGIAVFGLLQRLK